MRKNLMVALILVVVFSFVVLASSQAGNSNNAFLDLISMDKRLDANAKLKHSISGSKLDIHLTGHQLQPKTKYSLVVRTSMSPIPIPPKDPKKPQPLPEYKDQYLLLGKGISNNGGNININNILKSNTIRKGKVYMVPSIYYNESKRIITKWVPKLFLMGTGYMEYLHTK
ncbi:hypothetical protein ACFL4D_02330 [Candidatus Margulisiibacteriota bacterium]